MPKGISKLQVIMAKRGAERYNIQPGDELLFQMDNDFIQHVSPTASVSSGTGERLVSFDAGQNGNEPSASVLRICTPVEVTSESRCNFRLRTTWYNWHWIP